MPHIGAPHIPESLGSTDGGLSVVRDRGNGPKARPAVYRGVGAYAPASNDAVKVKAVSRKPMSRPKGALAL